jgi:beta-lactamase superfamily II metal-dependent hydrolase
VVRAYEAVKGHVIRTDENGAILITVDPTGRRLQTASRMRKMPFSWSALVGK